MNALVATVGRCVVLLVLMNACSKSESEHYVLMFRQNNDAEPILLARQAMINSGRSVEFPSGNVKDGIVTKEVSGCIIKCLPVSDEIVRIVIKGCADSRSDADVAMEIADLIAGHIETDIKKYRVALGTVGDPPQKENYYFDVGEKAARIIDVEEASKRTREFKASPRYQIVDGKTVSR